jgi:outer membrane protein OmpA-like peptidoglycan-associated protein
MSRMALLQSRTEVPRLMPAVQRSPEAAGRGLDSTARFGTAPPIVNEVLRTPGKALDPADRVALGVRFHHDFGKVRVHEDSRAAASAKAVDASAYAVGSHVVFDEGKYEPRSARGQQLLRHELIHTMQQSHGAPSEKTIALGDPADTRERQAEGMASGAVAQKPVATAPDFRVQRQLNEAPRRAPDLAESASPFLASAIGSVTIDGFETGKAEISKANQATLGKTARTIQTLLKKYPGSAIHVTGHTDAVGKEENNQTLGQARAESVQAALAGLGIPSEAIVTESKGETKLLVKTERAEARNRRVEVRFEPHTTPSLSAQPELGSTPSFKSFSGGSTVVSNTQSNARSGEVQPDTPGGHASPVPAPAKKETPPAVGEIKGLTELIKKTGEAAKKDPLVRKLRDAFAGLQPFMPAKDAKKEIDNAIDALVKTGSDAGIMAILGAITGRAPSQVSDQQRNQPGPYAPQKNVNEHILKGPSIPIDVAPKPAPKFWYEYRNGFKKTYAPGTPIKFTLVAPDKPLEGGKRLVIVADNDRNEVKPQRFGEVSLGSDKTMSIEMTAPQAPGKYVFRVDVGLGFDYSSIEEFEVTGPNTK